MNPGTKRTLLFLAWCGLGWATLLHGLGALGLLGPDEPRYAEIAAEMLLRHSYITPRLWGAVWLEKPILYYWLSALSQGWLGVGAAAARLPSAVLALLLSAALWAFLRRAHSPRAGVLAAFLSLNSAFFIGFGRAATTDMALSAPFALGMMALYLWLQESRRRWLALAAAALALATLAKGPVAVVLALLALAGFAACTRRWQLFPALARQAALPAGLFLLLAAPWYIAVQRENPEFLRVFILQHNLERFATDRFQHTQPFWFYVPVLALSVFPWSGWLGLPLAALIQRLRRLGWRRGWQAPQTPLVCFLACWLAAPVLFFSCSGSKLASYILPAVPAAVALIAVVAAECWERLPRWPLALSAVLAGLLPAALYLAPWLLAAHAQRPPAASVLLDPTTVLLGGATTLLLLLLALRRRGLATMAATCALVAAVALALARPPLSPTLEVALGGRPLGEALTAQCDTGLPQACGAVPLYTWQLNRVARYGAQFVLHQALAELPATPPANAIVLIDRAALPAFVAQFGGQRRLARLTRFDPAGSALPAPWLALRLAPLAEGK